MKDYLMFNKLKLTVKLLKLRLHDFFHPNLSYTINNNFETDKKKNLFLIEIDSLPSKEEAELEIKSLLSDSKSEIDFEETEIYFISNKEKDLN